MKRISCSRFASIAASLGGMLSAASAWAQPAQGGYGPGNGMGSGMMSGGWMGSGWMGGYGGFWLPVLLLVVVVGFVAWVVSQKKK